MYGNYAGFEKGHNLEHYGYLIFEKWYNYHYTDMSIPFLGTANTN